MGNLFIHPLDEKPMPKPDTIDAARQQNAANPATWQASILGTFRGWCLRYAVKLSAAGSLVVTTWLTAKWALIEQVASKAGADADTLAQLHAQGGTLSSALGALVATLITGGVEAILSRMAAKVAEQPTAPKALPV